MNLHKEIANYLHKELAVIHNRETKKEPQFVLAKTVDCPPLQWLAMLAKEQQSWSPEDRTHVKKCRYCQKAITLAKKANENRLDQMPLQTRVRGEFENLDWQNSL